MLLRKEFLGQELLRIQLPRLRMPRQLVRWRFLQLSLLVLCTTLLSGCITTETGGLPAPASDEKRLRAQLALARAFLSEREYDRAREPLDKALKIDSDSVETHVLFAVLSNGEGEPGIAEKYYKRAVKLGPDNAQALSNYGSFLISKRRAEEALPLLRRAVEDPGYPQRSQAYENLGIASLKVDDTEGAQLAFARAVSLDRTQARSNLELATMAYGDGDHVDAQELYNNYRKNARQTPRSLCLGMKIAAGLDDQDGVASHAIALKNLYPDSRQAKNCKVP